MNALDPGCFSAEYCWPMRTQVKLLNAALGEVPAVAVRGLRAPKGHRLEVQTHQRSDQVHLPNGSAIRFNWREQVLALRDRQSGDVLTLTEPAEQEFERRAKDFRAQHSNLTMAEVSLARRWAFERSYDGFGAAGHLLSVRCCTRLDLGGKAASKRRELMTYDVRTGDRVSLDQVLSRSEFERVVDAVGESLHTMKAPRGVDPSLFQPVNDQDLERRVAQGFGLSTGRSGVATLEVSWESGVPAAKARLARFEFQMPEF